MRIKIQNLKNKNTSVNNSQQPEKITKKTFFALLDLTFSDPRWFEKNVQKFFDDVKKQRFADDQAVLIKLENIGKKFSNGEGGTQVLFNDVNVVVKRGDVISLIGANGAGKSTLLDIVVGYQKPSSGAVSYSFKYDYSPTEKMGVSYQKNNLLSSLTVWDYIIFSHRLYKSRTSLRDLVVFVYAFGIEKFCKMKVQKLSGGQQQRLNAMLSLFHDPEIILLDELCNNLDMTIKTKIVKFIKQYITVKNITGIIISHDLFEIGNLSNRVLVIKNQRIKIDETTKNAIKKYKGLDKLVAASM